MPSNSVNGRNVLTELVGNTLTVYWYFLNKRNPVGVREIQRALGFSSSSTANYHLEKLRTLDLIDKDAFGNYRIKRVIRVGVLSSFLFLGKFSLPKHLLYAVITSLMIVIFALFFRAALSLLFIVALFPSIVAAVIFWYEAMSVWRNKPRFK